MVIEANSASGRAFYAQLRQIAVPHALSDLHAQLSGNVVLPLDLAWSGQREFDLNDSYQEKRLYERIITEARDPSVLSEFLNEQRLRQLWQNLFLSPFVRSAWEEKFPILHSTTRVHPIGV